MLIATDIGQAARRGGVYNVLQIAPSLERACRIVRRALDNGLLGSVAQTALPPLS